MGARPARDQLEVSAAAQDAHRSAEDVLLQALMSVRGLHLLQAAVSTATAWRSWRRPRLAAAMLAVSAAESVWYARRCGKRHAVDDPTATWVDTSVGVAGLVALRAATTAADCTTWMNWMCPVNLVTVAGAAASLPRRDSGVALAAVTSTYLLSVKDSVVGDRTVLATVVVSGLGYLGAFVLGDQFARHVRTSAAEIEEALQVAVEHGGRLAVERERQHQYRLITGSTLEALDLVAAGWSMEADTTVRSRVRREAARLRSALSATPASSAVELADDLRELTEDFAATGLSVELLLAELDAGPSAAATVALTDAAREALINVARHSGVSRAVVRAHSTLDQVELTVRDHGRGCDAALLAGHFERDGGVATKIVHPVRGVGGSAALESAPGSGMLVTLRVPRTPP